MGRDGNGSEGKGGEGITLILSEFTFAINLHRLQGLILRQACGNGTTKRYRLSNIHKNIRVSMGKGKGIEKG